MSAILKLVQGTKEWLDYRQTMRNASESAAVLGISPWVTPYQLWLIKTGRSRQAVTPPMVHGTQLEPEARRAYEETTGHVMNPLVMKDGPYSASLDGITLDGSLIVEIKCPFRGRKSELWKIASQGEVPEYYRVQIEHQLMVSGASEAHLWVYDGSEGLLITLRRDEVAMARIRQGWEGFQHHLDADIPPPLTEADAAIRNDPAWTLAAEAYLQAKAEVDGSTAKLEDARNHLVSLIRHAREQGAGVSVVKLWKQGNVDYKRVPELQGVTRV
jgi:putative phage-type endonuclease